MSPATNIYGFGRPGPENAYLFKIISCRVMPAKMAKTILKMMFVMFVITKMVKMIFFMIGRPAGDNQYIFKFL